MRVLLTGGTGFIGSHTALSLLEMGHDVLVYDSFINSSKDVVKGIKNILLSNKFDHNLKVIQADIRDKYDLDKVFKDSILEGTPIQAVIHFAGLKSVSESITNPIVYWDVNVCGTKNLLEIMSTNNCYSIVFSSSATIYGYSQSMPINENEMSLPINPYGRTKMAIENLLLDLYQSKSNFWRICTLRYFNPVGAHHTGLIGEDPIGIPNNLFPYITQVAIGRRNYLKVFGDDWDTVDGSGVRDYIHIMDLAEAHLTALNYIKSTQSCYEVINVGSGIGYSVFQIIKEFEISTGIKIPYKVVSRREGDIAISFADISKAKKLLSWQPKRSLKQICYDGWNWQKMNPNGYE